MSLPNSGNPLGAQKQPTNIYTMMLILAFLFMATSIGLLHFEVFERYSKKPDGSLYDTQPWRPVTNPVR